MPQTNGKELTTYCGLYCGACAIKNGQIRNAAASLQDLLKAYSYAEWAPLMAEFAPATTHYPEFEGVLEWVMDQDCPGCLEGGGGPTCPIRLCARQKELVGCWECEQDACDKLAPIDDKSPSAENRRRIREIGLEAWLEEQAAQVKSGFSYYTEP
jgi:hypothetical protein